MHADLKGHKPIHRAVLENDLEAAARLLAKRMEIDLRTDTGQTPLHLAVSRGSTRMVHVLLGYRADVNARDHQGQTPLHVAAARGAASLLTDLLTETGGDINLSDVLGNSPLHLAAAHEHTEVMDVLLSRGARIDAKNQNGHTPLYEAVAHQAVKAVELLLDKHATVNEGDSFARTPLHLAAKSGLKDIVTLLIDHGARVNAADQFGSTPLHEAALRGQLRVAAVLLQHGADLEGKDQLGRTPQVAAAANRQREMAMLLQKYVEHRAGQVKPVAPPPAPAKIIPTPTPPVRVIIPPQAIVAPPPVRVITPPQVRVIPPPARITPMPPARVTPPPAPAAPPAAAPPPPYTAAPSPPPSAAAPPRMPSASVPVTPSSIITEAEPSAPEGLHNLDRLRQQPRLFEEILDAIPDYLLLVDRDLRFTGVNRQMAQALGHAREDFAGRTWQDLGLPAECMLPLVELCATVFITRQVQHGTLTLPSREGAREMTCQLSPVHRPDGELACILCVAWDQSDPQAGGRPVMREPDRQDNAQSAALEAEIAWLRDEKAEMQRTIDTMQSGEERFRRLMEAGSEGILLTENGAILDANPQMSLITGYQHFELIGMHVLDLIQPEYADLAWKHIESFSRRPYRCYSVHKDGDPLWVEVLGKMLSLHDSRVSVAIIRPIDDPPQSLPPARTEHHDGAQLSVPPGDAGAG